MASTKVFLHKPSHFYGFLLLVTCILITAVQMKMYVAMIDHTVGGLPPGGLPFLSGAPEMAARIPPLEVALLKSRVTSRLNKEHPEYYFDLTAQWEIVLREAGIPFKVIYDEQLAEGVQSDTGILVMPMVACLGDAQKQSIRQFLAAGGGVVATGPLGARDENCKWLGWDYLQEITSLRDLSLLSADDRNYAVFRGAQYYSGSLAAGYRLELPRQEMIAGRAPSPDVYAGDWQMHPRAASMDRASIGIHGTHGLGRFVWFGFSESLSGRPASDRKALDGVMADAVRWVGKQPLAVLSTWPGKNQAAVMVTEEITGDYENAFASVEMLRAQGVPATFFLHSSEAKKSRQLVEQLAQAGEVASGGDSAESFAEQPMARQLERLTNSQRELREQSGSQPLGLNPPMGLLDQSTVAALKQAGFTYYMDYTERTSAVPDITEITSDALFPLKRAFMARVGRTGANDFDVISGYKGPTPWGDDMADIFLNDFRRIFNLGGAYTLNFSSQLLGTPENLHVVETAIKGIKKDPVWFTSGQRLTEWWSSRSEVRVESRPVQGRRIRVAVTNRGGNHLKDASVKIYLPYRPKNIRIIPIVLGKDLPQVNNEADGDILLLQFPELRAQSSHVFLLALDEK